jgi:predicted dehydrogenase
LGEGQPLALLSTNRVPSGFGSAVSKNLANDNFVLKQDNQHWDIKKQGLAGAPSLNLPLLDPGNESPSTSPSVSLSNSTKPKRRVGVIYIGPGQYSLDESHLEAMKRLKGNVELIAVVNKEINENQDSHGTVLANDRLQVVRRKVRDFLRNELGVALNDVEIDVPDGQGDDLVKASLSDGRRVSDIITEKIKAFKEKEKKEGYDTEVAVIVGTRSRYHMPYVQWALENNFHVLVDKPLTTPRWSINDTQKVEQSDSIVTDAQKLLQLSQQHSNVLTTIATQKRYGEILGRIRKVLAQSSSPIKYLQLTTNDGWWVDPDSLGAVTTRGESFSLEGDGGKLAHTGYHIFDLVPLILNDPGINGAQVRVVFQRPEDIVAYNNLTRRMIPSGNSWMDMKGKLEFNDNLNPADFKGLMEINANIEIVLTRKNGSKVIVNLGMFHGGPSSNSTPVGRTKTETVTLINEKGSLETARVDKFLYKGQKIKITASSVEGIDGELCPTENGDSVEPGSEFPENARPALDFFNTLLYTNNLNNINSRVTSPLVSHTIGIKLMAAALKAGYSGQTVSFPIIPSEWSQVRHVLETEGLPVNNAVSDQHLQSSASEDSQHGDDFAMLPPDLEEAFKQEDITPALERLQLLVKENTKQYATAEIRDFLLRMIGKRKSINQELRKALRQAPIDMLRDIDYDPSIHYVLVKDIMPIWTILQNYGDPMIFSERVIEEYIVQGKARIERQLFNPYVRDSAQVANAPDTAMADVQKKGGIDIQNIDVVRKNGIMKIQFNDQAVRNVLKNGFNGFTPIVINVISIQNPLPLLGINFDKNERALVKV